MKKQVPFVSLSSIVALSLIVSACSGTGGTTQPDQTSSGKASTSTSDSKKDSPSGPRDLVVLVDGGNGIGAGNADDVIKAREETMNKEKITGADQLLNLNYVKVMNDELKKQNVNLKYEDWGWSEPLVQKQTAAFLAQQGPDVIVGETQSPGFAAQGLLEPFPDWLEKEVRENVVEGAWKPMEYKGKIYGVAPQPGVNNLYWNKKLLKEAGLDPEKGPATWDEWVDMSKKIVEAGQGKFYAGGIYAGPNNGGYLRFGALPLINGGGFVDADNNPIFNSDKNIAAFELIRELNKYNPMGLMPNNGEGPFWEAFQKDQIAFAVDGPWRAQVCENLKMECGMGPIPLSKEGSSSNITIGASFFSVPIYAKNKEDAWKYIEIMIGTEEQQLIADAGIRPPVNRKIAESDDYKKNHPKAYTVYQALEGNVQGLPTFNKDNSKAWQIYGEAMVKSMMTDTPIKDILDDAQKRVLQVTK
ncbi:extracellular solute-binding protein [Paenibacillus sp. GCM10027626]|uniref:extracellular solute-binding protein n=1 Tax=Paenibacillus sp. GCM10027626 TaxID=3273411 RepID=UPI0036398522